MAEGFDRVEVMRGRHAEAQLFGPLPGARHGQVVAYEFQLPDSFEPWPGRTLLERTFVLLDLGVSFADVCWARRLKPDGAVVDRGLEGKGTWYVDLVTVKQEGERSAKLWLAARSIARVVVAHRTRNAEHQPDTDPPKHRQLWDQGSHKEASTE